MAATRTELLDELLAMARQVGSLEARAMAAEHRADMAPKGSTRKPRREARELWKLRDQRREVLNEMRTRFVDRFLSVDNSNSNS